MSAEICRQISIGSTRRMKQQMQKAPRFREGLFVRSPD
jgi:hypothetical protein